MLIFAALLLVFICFFLINYAVESKRISNLVGIVFNFVAAMILFPLLAPTAGIYFLAGFALFAIAGAAWMNISYVDNGRGRSN